MGFDDLVLVDGRQRRVITAASRSQWRDVSLDSPMLQGGGLNKAVKGLRSWNQLSVTPLDHDPGWGGMAAWMVVPLQGKSSNGLLLAGRLDASAFQVVIDQRFERLLHDAQVQLVTEERRSKEWQFVPVSPTEPGTARAAMTLSSPVGDGFAPANRVQGNGGAGYLSMGTSPLKLGAWRRIPYSDVAVLGTIPAEEPLQDAQLLTRQLLILLAVTALLVTAAGVVLGRRLAGPIQKLHRAIQRFDPDDEASLRPVAVQGNDEIAGLAATINAMALRIQERTANLRDTKEELDITIQTVQTTLLARDGGGQIALLNRSGCDLLGLTNHDWAGQNWLEDWVDPDDAALVRHWLQQAGQGALPPGGVLDYRMRTRHNGTRLVRWHLSLLEGHSGGSMLLLGSGDDITDRHAQQLELELARQEAEQANAAKSEFLSRMSLEWRTPMNAIIAVHQAAAEGYAYGLILLDWQLGDALDGLAVAERIRSILEIEQPRLVLVTAYGCEDACQQAPPGLLDACLAKPIKPSDLMDTLAELFGAGSAITPAPPSARQQRQGHHKRHPQDWGLQGLKVLLMEDNLINQQIAWELLEIVGVQTSMASNGVEAPAWLEEHGPQSCDRVLMDLNMPEMDGWECVRRIRADDRWQQLPVLAMTAHAMQQERDRCLALGMQDHITKPINPDHLYGCLQHWSGRQNSTTSVEAALQTSALALPVLEGFDTAVALERVAGNTDLYRRLLLSLPQTQADALERLDLALAHHDVAEAAHIAHTVKGVSANLGALGLAEAASALDQELRQGSCTATTKHSFAEELQRTMERIQLAFGALDTDEVAAQEMVPAATALSDTQRNLLATLNAHLLASDGEAVDLIDLNREALIAILGSSRYNKIAASLAHFNFIDAQIGLWQYLDLVGAS